MRSQVLGPPSFWFLVPTNSPNQGRWEKNRRRMYNSQLSHEWCLEVVAPLAFLSTAPNSLGSTDEPGNPGLTYVTCVGCFKCGGLVITRLFFLLNSSRCVPDRLTDTGGVYVGRRV